MGINCLLILYVQWNCVIWLLSTTWLRFQSLPLLYTGGETKLVIQITALINCQVAVMVNNFAEKVDECRVNGSHYCCLHINERTVGTFKIVCYIMVEFVCVPKFRSLGKCTMPLTNIQSN